MVLVPLNVVPVFLERQQMRRGPDEVFPYKQGPRDRGACHRSGGRKGGRAYTEAHRDITSVDAGGPVRGLRAGRGQIVATWHDSKGFSLVTVLEPVAQKPEGKQPKPQCAEKGVAGAGAEIPNGGTCH